jgi:hypothetical protein
VSPLSPPRKSRNQDVRPREYLTETEVESLIDAAASQGVCSECVYFFPKSIYLYT